MSAHDDMVDSVALLALGVLPGDEARAVAAHAHECAECAREYAELRVTANALGSVAEANNLDEVSSARMKSNLMRAVRGETNGKVSHANHTAPSGNYSRTRSPWLPYLAAAAAIVFAVYSTTNVASLRSQNDGAQQQIAQLHSELATQSDSARRGTLLEERLAEITAPESKHYGVPAGEIITSGGHVYLALKMGELAPGKVYQAWTLRSGARTVAPSVTFVAESGVTIVQLPESAAGIAAVAVSVEPTGGSKSPTSKPTFVRSLS